MWDACAASGGKSIMFHDYFPASKIYASDLRELILNELQQRIDVLKTQVDQNRQAFDEKRILVDELRRKNQQVQRNQFEAEKNVAIRDTSLANLDKSIAQLKEEHVIRQAQLSDLAVQRDENASALNTEKENFFKWIDEIIQGSDLIFYNVSKVNIQTAKRNKTRAGFYIELPKHIDAKKAYVNIKNNDDKCVLYCLKAHKHYDEITCRKNEPNSYKKFNDVIIPDEITYPIDVLKDIPKI
jgi:hypothetical protein